MNNCLNCKYCGCFYDDPDPGWFCNFNKINPPFIMLDDVDEYNDCKHWAPEEEEEK